MRVLTVCGSLQATSTNRDLLGQVEQRAIARGHQVVAAPGLDALPLFNPDILTTTGEPPAVRAWRENLSEADAVVFASPEYGHSLPGALKNAVDWVIGSGELYRKLVALTASVPHETRGQLGLEALAVTLRAVEGRIAWQAPIARQPGADDAIDALLVALERGQVDD